MFCPNCGKEIADNAVFCAGCGSRIQARSPQYKEAYERAEAQRQVAQKQASYTAAQNQMPYANVPNQVTYAPAKKKSGAPIIVIIILVIFSALAAIAYFLWSNREIIYPDTEPVNVTTAPRKEVEPEETQETDEFGDPINDDDVAEEDEKDEVEDEGKDEVEKAEKVDPEDRGGGEKNKE